VRIRVISYMNAPREKHNAKARQSTAGQRKKGKRKASSTIKEPDHDPNAEIIALKSEEQKELDRRERLRQDVRVIRAEPLHILIIRFLRQLIAQSESKINSKKKKKLDKYIVCNIVCNWDMSSRFTSQYRRRN
jgi:ATP-dependent RNA helicase DHX37/DHR1